MPTATDPAPKIYRMRIFAPNEVVAKSRFWYFVKMQRNVKRANGQILGVNQVRARVSRAPSARVWSIVRSCCAIARHAASTRSRGRLCASCATATC